MLWRKKRADEKGGQGDVIQPAELSVDLDPKVFDSKLQTFLEEIEEQGGLEAFITSLNAKQELFAKLLDKDSIDALDRESLTLLLEHIFTVRKRLPAVLLGMDIAAVRDAIKELLYGAGELPQRMAAFVDSVPTEDKKVQRAAWDFAAELLHFRDPDKYPLMGRWVWDLSTESGAMREYCKHSDSLREAPYDDSPGCFEAVRRWMSEQLAERGFYRDVPFLVDLLLAWAYSDYMRAMSSRMGMIQAEFGAKADQTEPVRKLLGIDEGRRGDKPRIKTETVH